MPPISMEGSHLNPWAMNRVCQRAPDCSRGRYITTRSPCSISPTRGVARPRDTQGDAGPPAVGVERQQQAAARPARGRGPERDVGRAHGRALYGLDLQAFDEDEKQSRIEDRYGR